MYVYIHFDQDVGPTTNISTYDMETRTIILMIHTGFIYCVIDIRFYRDVRRIYILSIGSGLDACHWL